MSLTTNAPRDIEQFVAEQLSAPSYPPFTIAGLKSGTKYRYKAVYILDTSKPAWMDIDGTWRYADGSAV